MPIRASSSWATTATFPFEPPVNRRMIYPAYRIASVVLRVTGPVMSIDRSRFGRLTTSMPVFLIAGADEGWPSPAYERVPLLVAGVDVRERRDCLADEARSRSSARFQRYALQRDTVNAEVAGLRAFPSCVGGDN